MCDLRPRASPVQPCRAGSRTRALPSAGQPAPHLVLHGGTWRSGVLRSSAAHRSLPVSGRWVPSCRSCYQRGAGLAEPAGCDTRSWVTPDPRARLSGLSRLSHAVLGGFLRVGPSVGSASVVAVQPACHPRTTFGCGEGRVRTCVSSPSAGVLATGSGARAGVLDDLSLLCEAAVTARP